MRPVTAVVLVGLALALGACGTSDEDQARDDVCSARADIEKQINRVQGLTLATASKDTLTSALDAIERDLKQIADARKDLNDDLKQQVQAANQTFKASLESAVAQVRQSGSLSEAATNVKAAIARLADSYKQALQPIDCG